MLSVIANPYLMVYVYSSQEQPYEVDISSILQTVKLSHREMESLTRLTGQWRVGPEPSRHLPPKPMCKPLSHLGLSNNVRFAAACEGDPVLQKGVSSRVLTVCLKA